MTDHAEGPDRPTRPDRPEHPDDPAHHGPPERASRPQRPAPTTRDAVVLGVAVGVFGVAFGVLAVATGLSPAQACVMSLAVFTGASQFAAVGVVDAGGSVATALSGALLLGLRNGVYGLALAPILRGPLATRLLAAQFVIDESTAMASASPDPARARRMFWTAGLSVFVFWNLGTALGALGGSAIGDPLALGLDAAFPAGFCALLAPQLRDRPRRSAAVLGGLAALVALPLLPPGMPVLAAALVVVPLAVAMGR